MNKLSSFAKRVDLWFPVLLAIVVLVLSVPSLSFGLIWDDPRWYRQGAGQLPWQILTSLPSYQFFRPLAILLNRQLVSPNGVVNVPLAHAIQIGAHLVAVLASVPVLRAFGFGHWHARLAALLFAVSPFAFQAVAWQAPQQPLTVMWLLLSILAADRFCHGGEAHWLGLSLAAYVAALLFQESAVPFVFVFFWLAMRDHSLSRRHRLWWPLLHLGLVVAYTLIWLSVPRQANVTGRGFQPVVLGYLLQGIVFPVSRLIAVWAAEWPLIALIAAFSFAGFLLVLIVWRSSSTWSTVWSCLWIGAGLLPIWGGLSWEYVETSERLLYPASLGIAALWAAWGAVVFSVERPKWRRGLGGLVCIVVLIVSFQQWWQFQKLYQVGTQHLARAIDILSESPDSRTLFVNFPDRIELQPRPYPLGFWGVTLAPIVQNLSDYALAERGRSGEDRTMSAFLVGADERRDWLYRVDMRGEDTPPEALFRAASWADAVYLTRYRSDGTLALQETGHIQLASASSPQSSQTIASFGDVVRLVNAQPDVSPAGVLALRLTWTCLKPLREHDTILVHFWRDGVLAGDADGDSLGGLIPLLVWQPGAEIVDVRQVNVSRWKPGQYQVRVGIYNRVDNTRYPAHGPGGERFADDEAGAATFEIR